MSHLQYYAWPGLGEKNRELAHLSQAVRVGDRIECSGQVGWDPQTGVVEPDLSKQIDLAFSNVEHNLRDAGGKGWEQVYRVNSYHVGMDVTSPDDVVMEAAVRNMRKWCPNHSPIWTVIGVHSLAGDGLKVEIEVVAHDPEGAEREKAKKLGTAAGTKA